MTFTEAQILSWLASIFWPMLRISALFLAMPVLGNKQLSTQVKALLALAIAILIAPMLDPPPMVELFSGEALLIFVQQILIGVVMGFSLQMVMGSLAIAGEMVGYSMKLGMAKMADPINGVQVPIVTTLYLTLAMLVILAMDIHLVLIELLVQSFEVFPIGTQGITTDSFWAMIGWGTSMYEYGLLMSIPIIGAILLLDLAQGVMQRAAQQFQIFAVGFPITLIAGLVLIWITLPDVLLLFVDAVNEVIQLLQTTILAGP